MQRLVTSTRCIALYACIAVILTVVLILSYSYIACDVTTARNSWLWICGFTVALILGHFGTVTALRLVRNYIIRRVVERREEIDEIYVEPLAVPAWLTGFIERSFFCTLVAFDISATAAGMLTWILIKMATDWHRLLGQGVASQFPMYGPRSLAFASLLAGIISLFFALIGGLICRVALDP
jgi:hypothetical protein